MAVDSLDPVAGLHTPGMLPQLLLVLLLHSAQAAPAPQDEDLPPMPVETSLLLLLFVLFKLFSQSHHQNNQKMSVQLQGHLITTFNIT